MILLYKWLIRIYNKIKNRILRIKHGPTQCTCCGWDTDNVDSIPVYASSGQCVDWQPEGYLGSKDYSRSWSFDVPVTWNSCWKCPRCGTEFTLDESEF